jgi:tetratricopeptide (TPR) repeat protein
MHPRYRTPHVDPPRCPLPAGAVRTPCQRRAPGVLRHGALALLFALATVPAVRAQDGSPASPPAVEVNAAPAVAAPPAPAAPARDPHDAVVAEPAANSAVPPAPPADLRHVQEWVDYRTARHLASLPVEARLFYRRGLMARQAGQTEAAMLDVRGAAELDPSFIEPHLALAAWTLTREPSQALLHYATVVDLLRQNFSLQLNLVANATILVLEALFFGLLAAGCLVVWLRRREATHAWQEYVGRFASANGARWWAPALLALPFLAGFGLTLPTLFFLGWLWPHLRVRERSLFVVLLAVVVATPLLLRTVERMSLPLHENAAPFYAVPTLENRPYEQAREDHLAALAAKDPSNPLLQFGLAWTARRGAHLETAERAYRRALELWPNDDRVLNNLGNVTAMAGRPDEALQLYARATSVNPANAAAWFNASQLHTQRFAYAQATEELSKASAINFELVKNYQSQATTDGLLPLVDQWLAPQVFWKALTNAPLPADAAGSLPVSLRRYREVSGWSFSVAALVLAILGLALGLRQQHDLALRACGNCGATVCRRCSERRREHALCPDCVRVEAQAESAEFARLMLARHRFERGRRAHLARIALATLIPGYGLLSHRHVFTAVWLLSATWLLTRAWLGTPPPFAIEPRLALSAQEVPAVLLLGLFGLVVATSVLGYVSLAARERSREAALAASQRGRITQSTRRITPAAA